MKNCTDLGQSRKLAGFLSFESADKVHHGIHLGIDGKYHLSGDNTENDVFAIDKEAYIKVFGSDICNQLPCWGLTALLNIIPEPNLVQNSEGTWLVHSWVKEYPWSVGGYSNPIDACVEMVLKLHELKLL